MVATPESVPVVDPDLAILIPGIFFAACVGLSVLGVTLFMRTQWYKDNWKS